MTSWRTFNMKTLYIPTSSLNFNNILSSESISPKSFYEKRDFGYSRWEVIPENPFKNVVLLYDSLSLFDRPKSDIEDHPMLIEVQIKENELKPFSDGIFYVDKTIYLSPDRTYFIFFSEKDKKITLSLSESSLETKLFPLYHRRIKIEKPNKSYKIINNPVQEPSTLNNGEIKKDIRLNKLKGLLYGYYIGITLSANIDDVKRLNTLKEIHNIFAAILSSINKRPTNIQKEALDTLFEKLNEDAPFTKELSKIVESPNKVSQILDLIKKFWGLNLKLDNHEFLNLLTTQSLDSDKENDAIQWIKGEIKKCQFEIECKRQLLSPEEEIIISSDKLTSLKSNLLKGDNESKLTQEWVNETLANSDYSGKISVNKDSLAKDITIKAKEIIGDNWENSIYKRHLNNLRHFIANEPIELEWNNDLLSSISAVLIYGDSWDKLLSNMQSKEMTDYSLAFAFFGELNGFANLTRDFTDTLYKNSNKDVLWNIYKKINGLLHADSLSGDTTNFVEKPNHMDCNSTNASSIYKERTEIKNQPESDHISPIPECLKSFFYSEPFQKLKKEEQSYYKNKTLELWDGNYDNDFFSKLKEIQPYGRTKRKWTEIIKQWKCQMKKDPAQQSKITGIEFPVGQYFYNDRNVWNHIEPLIPGEKDRDKISKDLMWFQDKFSKPKGSRGYTYDSVDEFDNKIVIEKFCSLKMGKNDKGQEQAPYFPKELREKIKSKLKELYRVN